MDSYLLRTRISNYVSVGAVTRKHHKNT